MVLVIGLFGGMSAARAGEFVDEFNGPTLHALWESYLPKPGPALSFVNGTLRIDTPADTAYNHTGFFDNAPQVRFDAPDGDFDFETRLTLPTGSLSSYHVGLMVMFSPKDAYYWGPYQRPDQLRLERTGSLKGTQAITGNAVSLRIQRIGSSFRFFYRTSDSAAWMLFRSETVSGAPLKVGLISRNSVAYALRADFTRFRLSSAALKADFSQGWIKANVRNGAAPVDGPWLIVRNAQGRQVGGAAYPAQSGRAAVFNLPPGAYTVKAVHPWIDSSPVQNVTVTAGQESMVDLQVVPCPSFSLLSNSKDVPALTGNGSWKLLPGPLNSNTPEMRLYRAPAQESYTPSGTDATLGGTWLSGVQVPRDYGQASISNNSVFWYRLDMNFPESYRRFMDREWILSGFNIDDEDFTYFNGQLVGATRSRPMFQSWLAKRDYRIPGNLIKPGGKNVLAIQGLQAPGGAGMTVSGPSLKTPSDSASYVRISLLGPDDKAADEVRVKVTSLGGAYSEEGVSAEGYVEFRWLPEGEYLVECRRSAALDPSLPTRISVQPKTYFTTGITIPVLP
ncbi:MAG: carboxypeptidase-like regulatory domain-containing protein [Armatimonadetes bacterium]|nr:carboxypeptidase-like regulatory domain-containing protein [Armatimonadota bacterium]